MADFLIGFALELIGELIGAFALESVIRSVWRILPMRVRYGTSWRMRTRREIMAKRMAAKGMA